MPQSKKILARTKNNKKANESTQTLVRVQPKKEDDSEKKKPASPESAVSTLKVRFNIGKSRMFLEENFADLPIKSNQTEAVVNGITSSKDTLLAVLPKQHSTQRHSPRYFKEPDPRAGPVIQLKKEPKKTAAKDPESHSDGCCNIL